LAEGFRDTVALKHLSSRDATQFGTESQL